MLAFGFTSPVVRILAGIILAFGFLAAPAVVASDAPNEYELKAVMLFNLARFVDWPANAFANSNSPVVIGVLGRNPFGDNLEKATQGETVNGRHLVVERFDKLPALKSCHILFISSSERSRLPAILGKLKGQSVLTVSEIDGFTNMRGGMVRFYTNEQKKFRLRLNLESARAEGLGVSSKLIQVAELDKISRLSPRGPIVPDFDLAVWSAPPLLASLAR